MSLSQRLPRHSLSWSLRTRITLLATTLLLLDRCQHVWQRLTSRKPTIINFPQGQPTAWAPDPERDHWEIDDPEIIDWLELLDEPFVQINCAAHLDRCLANPSASKNLNNSKSSR
jgi:hypothetical protein